MTDEKKILFDLLEDYLPVDLNELKAQSGLSNKKWDIAKKGLSRNGLSNVKNRGGIELTTAGSNTRKG